MSTRFLIAHAAKDPASDVAEIVDYIKRRIPTATVSTAREQWQTRLGSAGSADQLAVDMGSGTALNGEPLFHVIVCPRKYVGKRTAKTVQAALSAGRSVFYLSGITFVQVIGVNCVDQNDWKSGWCLSEPFHAAGPDEGDGGDGSYYG